MPWLINNSAGCKYWSYSHDQKLIKKIHNHHKQYTTKKLKHLHSQVYNNQYTLYFDASHFTDEEFNNSKNNIENLQKKIQNHFGNNHNVKVNYINNENTRSSKLSRKKCKKWWCKAWKYIKKHPKVVIINIVAASIAVEAIFA